MPNAVKKSKSPEPSKTNFGYVVEINQYCTRYHHSEEPYSEGEESYSNNFVSIRKSNGKTDYPDLISPLDLPVGSEVYLVWVEYSKNDSFTNRYCEGFASVAVFTNYEDAKAFEKVLRNRDTLTNDIPNGIYEQLKKFVMRDGTVLEGVGVSAWGGMFDPLEHVNIEHTFIAPPRERM